MKLLKVLMAIVLLVVLLAAGGVWYLNGYLQTPEFKQKVLTAARDALGTEVKITDMNVSLFSGVRLKSIVIGNPPGFPGSLLTADAFVLSYNLVPLLSRRVEVEQLSATKPVVTLSRNEKGEWNYAKIGTSSGGTPAAKPEAKPADGPAAGGSGAPALDIALSKLAVNDGEVTLIGEKGKPLTKIQELNFTSALSYVGSKFSGSGRAKLGTLAIAESLFVRQLDSPVSMTASEIKLSPATGKLANGDVTCDLTLKLTGGFKYLMNLQAKNSDVAKLLQEAGVKEVISGKLQGTTAVEGTGGLPTIVGKGRFEITNGQLMQLPLQGVLATLLQVAELREIKFDSCVLEYTLANSVLQTPVIKLSSAGIQVMGKGFVSLADYSLNHELTLALSKTLLAKVPKELQSAFKDRGDGFLTVDFRVSGPYDSPKTDLAQGLLKNAVQQQLQQRLFKLFK
ncbi:MAG: AsmA family protein [Verrucomicrobia bacterium]|nr:AsmA family protein [Verrucomicrobiota bacterium]